MIPGLGTALNTGTVLAGAAIGLSLGRVIPASLQRTIRAGLGLFVSVYGIQMTFKTRNPLILLVSVLVGVVIGELLHLDDGMQALGRWAERRTRKSEAAFLRPTTPIVRAACPPRRRRRSSPEDQ